jgi:hypothetical protein
LAEPIPQPRVVFTCAAMTGRGGSSAGGTAMELVTHKKMKGGKLTDLVIEIVTIAALLD